MTDSKDQLAEHIDRHLEAYIAKDIDAFAACYHSDVKVSFFANPQKNFQGRQELKERYQKLFEVSGKLNPQIQERIVVPPYVIDKEYVTGLPHHPNGLLVGVVYWVENDLIKEMCFLDVPAL